MGRSLVLATVFRCRLSNSLTRLRLSRVIASSPSRMTPIERFKQHFPADVRINLRTRQLDMTQQLLNLPNVGSAIEHVCRKAMSHRTRQNGSDTGPKRQFLEDDAGHSSMHRACFCGTGDVEFLSTFLEQRPGFAKRHFRFASEPNHYSAPGAALSIYGNFADPRFPSRTGVDTTPLEQGGLK